MSDLNIVGIQPADKHQWERMKAVYDACLAADVEVPDAVMEYFGYESPTDKGVCIDLNVHASVVSYEPDVGEIGYEIQLDKLPPNIKFLRVYTAS